jgi:hypothetical protein
MGCIQERKGDIKKALEYYQMGLKTSEELGFTEGSVLCKKEVDRLAKI